MVDSRGAATALVGVGLDEIVERCRLLVSRVCRSRLSGLPSADVEDAVQETFLQLAQAKNQKIKNLEAWLITVAMRVCARTLRQRYRAPTVPLSEAVAVPAAEAAVERVDEQLWLAKVASLLPTTDAKLLHMLYLQDMTYDEVAKYFDTTNGNARVLAYRARQHARGVIYNLR